MRKCAHCFCPKMNMTSAFGSTTWSVYSFGLRFCCNLSLYFAAVNENQHHTNQARFGLTLLKSARNCILKKLRVQRIQLEIQCNHNLMLHKILHHVFVAYFHLKHPFSSAYRITFCTVATIIRTPFAFRLTKNSSERWKCLFDLFG